MIIVNLFGIIIGLISMIVVTALGSLFPNLLIDRWGDAFLVSAAILAFIGECFGLKARIFIFIPVWLLGLLYAGFKLQARWGAVGIVASVVAAGALFSILYAFGKAMERRAWQATQKRLVETDLRQYNPETADFWKTIKSVFFVPASIPNDRTLCQHNRQIITFLLEKATRLTEEQIKSLQRLDEQLHNGETSVKPVKIDFSLYNTVGKLIEDRARPPKRTPPPLVPKTAK